MTRTPSEPRGPSARPLRSRPAAPQTPVPTPASTPQVLSETFDRHEQGETRMEPRRKLSSDTCGTCRKPKHYGTCSRPIPIKRADFNLGMTADDAESTPADAWTTPADEVVWVTPTVIAADLRFAIAASITFATSAR